MPREIANRVRAVTSLDAILVVQPEAEMKRTLFLRSQAFGNEDTAFQLAETVASDCQVRMGQNGLQSAVCAVAQAFPECANSAAGWSRWRRDSVQDFISGDWLRRCR